MGISQGSAQSGVRSGQIPGFLTPTKVSEGKHSRHTEALKMVSIKSMNSSTNYSNKWSEHYSRGFLQTYIYICTRLYNKCCSKN